MVTIFIPDVCKNCKHIWYYSNNELIFKNNRLTCKAFNNGIVDEVYYGENDHRKPIKGDNNIQFEHS